MLDDITNAASGSVSVTTEEGLGQRLLNSIVGVIVGVVLFLLSFVVLWWNEGNVIEEKNALNEMGGALVEAKAQSPDKAQSGKLVHAVGRLESDERIGDAPYLKPGPYLLAERHVEMYQWLEKSKKESSKSLGGKQTTKTTYYYVKDWAEGQQDSAHFQQPAGHANPQPDIPAKNVRVKRAHFGKFDGAAVVDRIDARQPLQLTTALVLASGKGKDKDKNPELKNGMLYIRKVAAGSVDQIGDERVSYRILKAGTFSVIAKQAGTKFAAYAAKNGKEKFLVEAGDKPAKAMIQSAKEEAGTMAMVLRVVGFFMMWIGMNLLAAPIVTLLDVIPFLGSAGRFVLGIVFFVASLVLTLVTVVVAMIAHHPVVLVLCLMAAGGAGYYLWDKKKKGRGIVPAGVGAVGQGTGTGTGTGATETPGDDPSKGSKARPAPGRAA